MKSNVFKMGTMLAVVAGFGVSDAFAQAPAAPVAGGRQAGGGAGHRRDLRPPRLGPRYARGYTFGLSRRHNSTGVLGARLWSKRPAAAGRGPLPRGGPGRRLAAPSLRQWPHDGLRKRGVREERHGRPTHGDMAGGRSPSGGLGRSDVSQSGPASPGGLGRLKPVSWGHCASRGPV